MTLFEAREFLKKEEAVKRGFEPHYISPGFSRYISAEYNSLEARDIRECPEKYTDEKKCTYCFNLKITKKKEIKPGVKVFYCRAKAEHLSNLKENKKPLDSRAPACPFFCDTEFQERVKEAERIVEEAEKNKKNYKNLQKSN